MPEYQDDLSDLIAEVVYANPQARERLEKLRKEVEMFGSLRDHVGWQRLRARAEAQRTAWVTKLGEAFARGEVTPQRQIDYDRGWFDACQWLLKHPEISEDHLQKALTTAWALREGGEGITEIPDSPHL